MMPTEIPIGADPNEMQKQIDEQGYGRRFRDQVDINNSSNYNSFNQNASSSSPSDRYSALPGAAAQLFPSGGFPAPLSSGGGLSNPSAFGLMMGGIGGGILPQSAKTKDNKGAKKNTKSAKHDQSYEVCFNICFVSYFSHSAKRHNRNLFIAAN